MIAESNGTITKVVLRNNNSQYFLDDVCSALVNSGWTEVMTPSVSDYPWNRLGINNTIIGENSWIEPFPGEKYFWKRYGGITVLYDAVIVAYAVLSLLYCCVYKCLPFSLFLLIT